MDYKIPERPKGNTMEALHWDIDQRNDKIQRLNKKLENSMFENVRLTFSEPTRKQIRTSQDMEVQARFDLTTFQTTFSFSDSDTVMNLFSCDFRRNI